MFKLEFDTKKFQLKVKSELELEQNLSEIETERKKNSKIEKMRKILKTRKK